MESTRKPEDQLATTMELAQVDALVQAMKVSVGTPQDKQWQYVSYKSFARKYNNIIKSLKSMQGFQSLGEFELSKIPSPGDALIFQYKEIFDMVYTEALSLQALLANLVGRRTGSPTEIEDFIQIRLRSAMHSKPTCEKDIQNAIDTLFIGRDMQKGVDYGREIGRVHVSSKEVIPDFVVYSLSLAIEVKFLGESKRQNRIVDEIAADITQYSAKYSQILFVVYDLGCIKDERHFRQGLIDPKNTSNIRIVIVKH